MPFLKNTLAGGGQITLRGRAVNRREGLVLEHPEIFYPSEKYEEKLHTLQPIYNLTAGLTNNAISKAVKQVVESLDLTKEHLPEEIRLHYQLAEYIQPLDKDEYQKFLGTTGDELEKLMQENQDVLKRLKERE